MFLAGGESHPTPIKPQLIAEESGQTWQWNIQDYPANVAAKSRLTYIHPSNNIRIQQIQNTYIIIYIIYIYILYIYYIYIHPSNDHIHKLIHIEFYPNHIFIFSHQINGHATGT